MFFFLNANIKFTIKEEIQLCLFTEPENLTMQ